MNAIDSVSSPPRVADARSSGLAPDVASDPGLAAAFAAALASRPISRPVPESMTRHEGESKRDESPMRESTRLVAEALDGQTAASGSLKDLGRQTGQTNSPDSGSADPCEESSDVGSANLAPHRAEHPGFSEREQRTGVIGPDDDLPRVGRAGSWKSSEVLGATDDDLAGARMKLTLGQRPSEQGRAHSTVAPQPQVGAAGDSPEYDDLALSRFRLQAEEPNAIRSVAGGESNPEIDRARGSNEAETDAGAHSGSLGDMVLQSLLSQRAALEAPVSDSEVNPRALTPQRIEAISQLLADTTSRLLVSDPTSNGPREVRVELARELLPDTDVRLWRQEGQLHVEFTTRSAVSQELLQESLPRLVQVLQAKAGEPELPQIGLRSALAGDHPQDGRSRQSYVRPDDDGEAV